MSTPVLSCTDLCKSYKNGVSVLKDFNWTVPGGKIVGLLGPNGCGKSTLIKMISGILVPDGGQIEVCGQKRSEKTNALISYLPERTYINSWMKVDELIRYFAEFYADFDEETARKMLSDLSIDANAKLKTLSKGTKEKVQLIMVMSRRAKLYLLDEFAFMGLGGQIFLSGNADEARVKYQKSIDELFREVFRCSGNY